MEASGLLNVTIITVIKAEVDEHSAQCGSSFITLSSAELITLKLYCFNEVTPPSEEKVVLDTRSHHITLSTYIII